MAKKHPKQCAYCGKVTTDWDKDHPVPTCLWDGQALPLQMITVRCCCACNRYWSLHDGYFRSIVAMICKDGAHPLPAKMITGSVKSHFEKDKVFRRSIVNTFRMIPATAPNGLYLGRQPSFDMDWNRLSAIIGKITRGLFFWERKEPVPLDYHVVACKGDGFARDPDFQPMLNQLPQKFRNFGGDDDVFMGRCGYDVKDHRSMLFHLVFFRSVQVLSFTGPVAPDFVDTSHPDYVAAQLAERDAKKKRFAKR